MLPVSTGVSNAIAEDERHCPSVNTNGGASVCEKSRIATDDLRTVQFRPMEDRDQVLSEDDVSRIVEHMNAEHEDDLLLFAQVYAGEPGATAARMTGIDAEGLTLEATVGGETEELRIDFDTSLHTPEEAHRTLVDLALNARG